MINSEFLLIDKIIEQTLMKVDKNLIQTYYKAGGLRQASKITGLSVLTISKRRDKFFKLLHLNKPNIKVLIEYLYDKKRDEFKKWIIRKYIEIYYPIGKETDGLSCPVCSYPVFEGETCQVCLETITFNVFDKELNKYEDKLSDSFYLDGDVYVVFLVNEKRADISLYIPLRYKKLDINKLFEIYLTLEESFTPKSIEEDDMFFKRLYIKHFTGMVNYLRKRRKRISITKDFLYMLEECFG